MPSWWLFFSSDISGIVPAGTPGKVGGTVVWGRPTSVVGVSAIGADAGLDDPLGLLGLGAQQDALGEHGLVETGDHPPLVNGRDVGRVEVDGHAGERPEVHLGQGGIPGVGQQQLLCARAQYPSSSRFRSRGGLPA